MKRPFKTHLAEVFVIAVAVSGVLAAAGVITPLALIRVIVAGAIILVVTAAAAGIIDGGRRVQTEMARLKAEHEADEAKFHVALKDAEATLEELKALRAKPIGLGTAEDEIHPGDLVEVNPKTGRLRRVVFPPPAATNGEPIQ